MSMMKHLLRKLHIGGTVTEPGSSSSPSPSPSILPSPSISPSSSLLTSSSSERNRGVDASERVGPATAVSSDNSVDFNFFEEEFQVQLALAMSVSDPDGREDPESVQIKAAKQLSLGCSPSLSNNDLDFLSLQYRNYSVVNYDEKVADGFYDVYGITSNSGMQGKMPLLVDLQDTPILDNADYEVILVNRLVDHALQQLESRAISIALECGAAELGPISSGLVQKIADLVVDSMGGPVGDADEMLRRWTIRSYELRNSLNTIIFPLGCLNVGLSRHRALLFKVLADAIDLPCRLVKGSFYTCTDEGAVNLIKIDHGNEYIIDLMGAPGMLIPAEIPTNHLQNSRLDGVSFVNTSETVKDSHLVLDKVKCQFDNRTGTPGVSPDYDNAPKIGGSGSEETLGVGIQSKGNGGSLVEKNQTERFEHDFGNLLPSLRRSREASSGTGGKASSAQKMKVKDVSKYVISAAQNPEFAQKLHAVLLESGASPPPNLFSDMAPQDLGEQKMLEQSHLVERKKVDDGAQRCRDKFSSSNELSLRPSIKMESLIHFGCDNKQKHSANGMAEKRKEMETTVISQELCLPFVTTSDDFVLVPSGVNEMIRADTTGIGIFPVNSSPLITGSSNEEHIHESVMLFAVDSCQRQLENALADGGAQFFLGNAGIIPNNVESKGSIRSQERQLNTKESMEKFMETANNDPHIAINAHSERINPMLDEVAEWEIPWEDLQIGERIGLGSYGEVYHADWNATEVAVKKFLDQDFSGDALDQFRSEIRIMRRLRHPNVVLFMGAVTRPPNLSILTEFLPRGSLYRLLHRPNIHLDEKRRMRMAFDVAKGMNYLHTSHPTIVHRDLKSPNLLVDKNWVVKVCDFGLSRLKHNTFLSSKSTAGTPEWMAPEVLRNEPSNEKCDVYSFGVILWELATLRMPWSGMNPMQVVGAVGFQNRRLEIPEEVDPMVAEIIMSCWKR
ncbi:hypothetical protein HHK36_006022 [Tetracentron sinense]|uniref:non-specific serine/threonine protein kinase n=1 Tax=Tetracentron sinense TaxID=13715 RepID=A0A834ZHC1_TETSI|nr:hypothetical protein HHK36_006022 [Tetracentron sinense]